MYKIATSIGATTFLLIQGCSYNLTTDEPIVSVAHSDASFSASMEITEYAMGQLSVSNGAQTMDCRVVINYLGGNIRNSTGAKDFNHTRGVQTSFDLTISNCSQSKLDNSLGIKVRDEGYLQVWPYLQTQKLVANLLFIVDRNPVASDVILWKREKVAQLARDLK